MLDTHLNGFITTFKQAAEKIQTKRRESFHQCFVASSLCWLKLAIANKHKAILDITVQLALLVWSSITLPSLFFSQHVTDKRFIGFVKKVKQAPSILENVIVFFFFITLEKGHRGSRASSTKLHCWPSHVPTVAWNGQTKLCWLWRGPFGKVLHTWKEKSEGRFMFSARCH